MNNLSNAFALLELDVTDDGEQTITVAGDYNCEKQNERDDGKQTITVAGDDDCEKQNERDDGKQTITVAGDDDCEKQNERAKGKKRYGSSGNITNLKNENGVQQISEVVPGEYKLPLVWIDLEMTGLNVEIDRILEIACIITDGNLTKSKEGPDLIIHQTKECLDKMGEWCQEHHSASGLTQKVLRSTITEREAELQVVEFVKKNVGTYTPLLAGNSVYVDFQFIKQRQGTMSPLVPKRKAPQKENKHRAMDDIKESIAELKYYKEHIFKASKNKK